MKENGREKEKDPGKEAMETAIDTFMELLPEMLKDHEGTWVVLRGGDKHPLGGFWHCEVDANKVGYMEYGPHEAFLVREVSRNYLKPIS